MARPSGHRGGRLSSGIEMPHPDIPQDGLIYSVDAETGVRRVYARIDVSYLTDEQIAEVREFAEVLGNDNCLRSIRH